MIQRAIIRPWWGDRNREDGLRKNRRLMETTLRLVLADVHQVPFVVYVFGKDNHDFLKSEGADNLVLVDNDPLPRKQVKRNYIHRLDLCKVALEDFDEIVCMNWNCRLIKPFPDNFWSIMENKGTLQAPLIKTRTRMLGSRHGMANRTFPNDSFIYMGDKNIADKLLDVLNWPKIPNKWTPESLMAHYMDKQHGGWIGYKRYWDLYEPMCMAKPRGSPFKGPEFRKPEACFGLKGKKQRG